MLVVDASVAVKVLIEEPGSAKAAVLLAEAEGVIAPTILRMEVASALAKKVRFHDLPASVALVSFDELDTFVPAYVSVHDLLPRAFRLSIELNHALQDCVYLALAMERDGILSTADRKFIAAIRRAGMERYAAAFVDGD